MHVMPMIQVSKPTCSFRLENDQRRQCHGIAIKYMNSQNTSRTLLTMNLLPGLMTDDGEVYHRRRAKEKRERLRSAHLAPDYIPLGGAAALTSNQAAAEKLRGSGAGGEDAGGEAARGSDTGGSASDSDGEGEPGQDLRMQFGAGAAPSSRSNARRHRGSKSSGMKRDGGSGSVYVSALHEASQAAPTSWS